MSQSEAPALDTGTYRSFTPDLGSHRLVPLTPRSELPKRPAIRRDGGRVLVVSATVGQGHEGAARELARRLRHQGLTVDVHDYLDALSRPARGLLRDLYRPTVQYAPPLFDQLFRSLEHEGVVRAVAHRLIAAAEEDVLQWSRCADLVVTTYPFAGQTLGRLRENGRLAVPAVTYLTDPAAHALWCHSAVDHHLTVTRATAQDAARYGVAAEAAGPLCSPGFGVSQRSSREVRAELGLPEDAPVVLLSAGSLGMGDIPRTVTDVLRHPQARVVVLCGHNEALRRRLERKERVVALGWRTDVADLMAAAHLLVHNAGGLSLTEALVVGLPALTYRPIPGHGRANAATLEQAGLALWPRDVDGLVGAIDQAMWAGRGRRVEPWHPGADPAAAVRGLLTRARAA